MDWSTRGMRAHDLSSSHVCGCRPEGMGNSYLDVRF